MLRRIFGTGQGATQAAATGTTVYSASNPPSYVYKIVPHSSVNPRYAFPVPIPQSHEFVLSELDAKDGYIHLSTAPQLSSTLNRFFKDDPVVMLLKIDFGRLSGFKVVKWADNGFPHLYNTIEPEYVDSVEELKKKTNEQEDSAGEEKVEENQNWDKALDRLVEKGWLE